MVLVSMAGEDSGFPGSALNSLPFFPLFLVVSDTVVFPFILNGKGHARFKKKKLFILHNITEWFEPGSFLCQQDVYINKAD